MDEVGPLEMGGEGWSSSINELKDNRTSIQLWVVREKLLREVMLNHLIPEENLFRSGEDDVEKILQILKMRMAELSG